MLKIEENLGGVEFSIQFEDKVNLITGYSDTGKTFLFTMMTEYLNEEGVSCIYFNSDNTYIPRII